VIACYYFFEADEPLCDVLLLLGMNVFCTLSMTGKAMNLLKNLFLPLLLFFGVSATHAQTRNVVVNHQRLDTGTIHALEQRYGVQVLDGRYWYDPMCGAWGFEGGPGVGLILPGLKLGGPLHANASNGNTGVFVNGRELHAQDVAALQQLVGVVYQGRFWLDAYGNVGYEGGPALLNLAQVARQRGGGNTFYRSSNTDIGAGSSGGTSYVMGKDWSVTIDH